MFRKIRENGEWGTPEQKKGIFYICQILAIYINNSRTFGQLSDINHDNKSG